MNLVWLDSPPTRHKYNMARHQHFVRSVQHHLVLPLQMNGGILLVGEPLMADGTLKLVANPALEAHVSVQVIIPVVALATLETRESLRFTATRLVVASAPTC